MHGQTHQDSFQLRRFICLCAVSQVDSSDPGICLNAHRAVQEKYVVLVAHVYLTQEHRFFQLSIRWREIIT